MLGCLEEETPAVAIGPNVENHGQPIDMAGNDVAAELVTGPQGPLKVDARTNVAGVERRLRSRLVRDVDSENTARALRPDSGHGQATAVARDRGARRNCGDRVRGPDSELSTPAFHDLADIRDDPCEHQSLSGRLSWSFFAPEAHCQHGADWLRRNLMKAS